MSDLIPTQQYSPKEIAIFEAVAALLHAGRKSHELKVAEIAKTAGIGKGTAYEYFSCKNELIRQAFTYHIDLESRRLDDRLNQSNDFKDAFFDLFAFSLDMVESRMPSLWAMLSTLDPDEASTIISNGDLKLKNIVTGIDDKLEQLMQKGMQQGYLDSKSTRSYRHFVLTGTLSAFIQMARRSQMQSLVETEKMPSADQEIQQLQQDAWLMLRRSLASPETNETTAKLG